MDETGDTQEHEEPKRAVVKRRWALMPGTGAAVIAVAAAIALGDPAGQIDSTQDPTGGDSQISAEA